VSIVHLDDISSDSLHVAGSTLAPRAARMPAVDAAVGTLLEHLDPFLPRDVVTLISSEIDKARPRSVTPAGAGSAVTLGVRLGSGADAEAVQGVSVNGTFGPAPTTLIPAKPCSNCPIQRALRWRRERWRYVAGLTLGSESESRVRSMSSRRMVPGLQRCPIPAGRRFVQVRPQSRCGGCTSRKLPPRTSGRVTMSRRSGRIDARRRFLADQWQSADLTPFAALAGDFGGELEHRLAHLALAAWSGRVDAYEKSPEAHAVLNQ
jgi:hypothetical protein